MLIILFLNLIIGESIPALKLKATTYFHITQLDTLPQYFLLQKTLLKYEKNVFYDAKGKIDFRNSDSSTLLQEVFQKLYHLGYEVDTLESKVDSKRVYLAIGEFQEDHSLKKNEWFDKEFKSLINVPISEWIIKIKVNMLRAAQMPSMHAYQVWVNIPTFEMMVYDHDSLVMTSKIIVGKRKTKTALITGTFEYVVFNPYWNIPKSILIKEIIPEIEKDPDYLQKNDMEWVHNRLRQRPGPKNALGNIKFIFPNPYNIYLHDTPNKSLFLSSRRMFSHGCIRIANPKEFAYYLLSKEKNGWTLDLIDKKLNQHHEEYVKLDAGVRIMISYLTIFVAENGHLQYRNDIYGLD